MTQEINIHVPGIHIKVTIILLVILNYNNLYSYLHSNCVTIYRDPRDPCTYPCFPNFLQNSLITKLSSATNFPRSQFPISTYMCVMLYICMYQRYANNESTKRFAFEMTISFSYANNSSSSADTALSGGEAHGHPPSCQSQENRLLRSTSHKRVEMRTPKCADANLHAHSSSFTGRLICYGG